MERSRKAFTLIELLVVIAIIGILATIVIMNVSLANAKARDAKRKSDISSISRAIKMYQIDNGSYPAVSPYIDYSSRLGADISTWNWSWLNTSLQSYFATLPKDPKNNGTISSPTGFNYYYTVGQTKAGGVYDWFTIWARDLENTTDSQTCLGGKIYSININDNTVSPTTFYDCNCSNPPVAASYYYSFGISSNK